MTFLRRDNSCLHAAGTAADNQDFLLFSDTRQFCLKFFFFTDHRIHGAGHRLKIHHDIFQTAVVTNTRTDIFYSAFFGFIRPMRIGNQTSGAANEISIAVQQDLFRQGGGHNFTGNPDGHFYTRFFHGGSNINIAPVRHKIGRTRPFRGFL